MGLTPLIYNDCRPFSLVAATCNHDLSLDIIKLLCVFKEYLDDLKFRLNQSRTKSPLFDTKGFTRNLEEIFFKLVKNL